MNTRSDSLAAERLAALALFACGLIAVLTMPRDQVPAGWLVAWTAPAMLFGAMRRHTHHPWLRAFLAVVTQAVAFAAAVRYAGPLARPAVLACTILPPLAFVAVRRREADAPLALFLSFCVLLVGVILGGDDPALLGAYVVFACLSLRSESHLAAVAVSRRHRWRTVRRRALKPVLASALVLALPCLFVAFAVDRTLAWIPSPLQSSDVESGAASASSAVRRPGLDDRFLLGSGGILSDLAGEQLVLVRPLEGGRVPSDLYLRSGFFAVAHFDRWEIGPRRLATSPGQRDHDLRRPTPVAPVRWLEVERFAGARNFVFVPPTAIWLRGVTGLQFDPERLWLRQVQSDAEPHYRVAYQELPPAGAEDRIAQSSRDELLGLPPDFTADDRSRFEWLLDQWGATGSAWEIAERIAAGLSRHCRYDRIEPTGRYGRTIDNFLFAEGDRRGFCMHFASAAALMLRLRGIPCRIGVGLYGGDPDQVEPAARVYGSQHAHAWVEIPCAGRGFAVFDPTPPAERGQRMPTQMDPNGADADSGPDTDRAEDDPWLALLALLSEPWLLGIVLIVALATTMWPGRRQSEPQIVLSRSAQTARRLLARILRALAESGHLRRRGQTLEQFGAVLAGRDRLDPAVAASFRTYQEVRFGGRTYDEQRENVLLQGLEAARLTSPWEEARSGRTEPRGG